MSEAALSAAQAEGYRPCVGIMVINKKGLVLVAQRLDMPSQAWQMPQGGIDKGEDPLVAAYRELEEETSITSVKVIGQAKDWLRYDVPKDLKKKLWKGRYKGQVQRWFAMRFLGEDKEINLHTKHPEFSTWQWVEAQMAPDLIVDFKRDLYRQVLAQLGHFARPL